MRCTRFTSKKVHLTQRTKVRNAMPNLHLFESSNPIRESSNTILQNPINFYFQDAITTGSCAQFGHTGVGDMLLKTSAHCHQVNSRSPSPLSFIATSISLPSFFMTFSHKAVSKIFWGKISFPASSRAQ